jgi:hypothetical protein
MLLGIPIIKKIKHWLQFFAFTVVGFYPLEFFHCLEAGKYIFQT